MTKKFIAVVDSGSGGLSVWKELVKLLPHESVLYVGDHAYLPYSEKTTGSIRNRIKKILRFFRHEDVKLVVIACNTATVAGIDYYRKAFPSVPIIGVVPVVKTAAQMSKKRSFAVISTNYTAASRYQRELIKRFAPDCRVFNFGCSNLVRLVERGMVQGPIVRRHIAEVLSPLKLRDIDCLALGCTHYPFLTPIFRDIVGKGIRILDSGGAVARHAKRVLKQTYTLSTNGIPIYRFLTTGEASVVSRVAGTLLGRKAEFVHITV